MKIVNYSPAETGAKAGKLKIASIAALFLIAVPIFFVILVPINVQADGLVPCGGIDCTICDFFLLFQKVFNEALVLVPIVAVGFVCLAGYNFLIGGSKPDKITKAKSILWNTFIGIVIFYSAYAIVSFAIQFFAKDATDFGFRNGAFTFSCPKGIGGIDDIVSRVFPGGKIRIDIPADIISRKTRINISQATFNEEESGGSSGDTYIRKIGQYAFVTAGSNTNISYDVRSAFDDASTNNNILGSGSGKQEIFLLIVDGKRTLQEQQSLVAKNCPAGATSSTACTPPTCIPKTGIGGSNCQHVGGYALDVWSVNGNAQQLKDTESQNRVISVMKQAGFCVYDRERWHFELKTNVIRTARTGVFDCL